MDASQQYQGKTLRAPAEWWERVIAWAGANGFKESEAIRELCIRQLDAEALGKARVQAGPSLDEMRTMMADLLATHEPTTRLAPTPVAPSVPSDVLDALADLGDEVHAAHRSAEAALQAVAYQRDHPNKPAPEIIRLARDGADNRIARERQGGAA